MAKSDLKQRVAALEATVAGLTAKADPPTAPPAATADDFWVLRALEERYPDTVLFAGSVFPETDRAARWQMTVPRAAITKTAWGELASTLDALAHPVRLSILQQVLDGTQTTGALLADDSFGTTGQLHHHLRQLVAAGWLVSTRRGSYQIPTARVVPLLIILLAARR